MKRSLRDFRTLAGTAAAALCLTVGAVCSTAPVSEPEADQLFEQAEEEIQNDHLLLATEHLKTLRNKFPYSKFAPLAQLRLGDVYFQQESYGEAAPAYMLFLDLYPKHEKAPYALFRAAKSYFNDMPEQVARDLAAADHAIEAYGDFLRRFPADPLRDEAARDLIASQDLLARKEKYVADFYRRRGAVDAARARLEGLVARYPNTPTAKEAGKILEEMSSK